MSLKRLLKEYSSRLERLGKKYLSSLEILKKEYSSNLKRIDKKYLDSSYLED